MKVLLATGIFYPDVGGPAIHVRKIAERLSGEGFDVTVLAYGDDPEGKELHFKVQRISRNNYKMIQWLLYFFYAVKFAMSSRLIYAFDPTAAGVPACIASWFFRKPFIIRMGGDPIWEREVETGRRFMSIGEYYEKSLYLKDKPLLYKMIRQVLLRADMVVLVCGQQFKDFYPKYYGVPAHKIRIIKNPIYRKEFGNTKLEENPTFIFAGRFVSCKNLILTIKAFDNVRKKSGKGQLLLIGKGPDEKQLKNLANSMNSRESIYFLESLPQERLFEKVKESSIALGPALSEFNPNFILECLSFGKPVILSKNNGLSVDLPSEFIFDPMNQKDLEDKMENLLHPDNYQKAVDMVNKIKMDQTWDKVTDFHLDLVKEFAR